MTEGRIHINRPDLVHHSTESLGAKWCFGCCKRTEHTLTTLVEREPGYYGPTYLTKCARCGKNRTHFPGRGPA